MTVRHPLTVLYRGNFLPDLPPGVRSWSTESEVARAWRDRKHTVIECQEDRVSWEQTLAMAQHADLFLWTSTYGMAHGWPQDEAHAALTKLKGMLPTVSWHLDRFIGLPREDQVPTEPWFRTDVVFTADGGHDQRWHEYGVEHVWLPPAVSRFECEPHESEPERWGGVEVGFVGNWAGGYHPEWVHRRQLVRWLRRTYRGRVGFWPVRGEPAVRGDALRSLYASVPVLVGDSCLVGGQVAYCSDRIPESLGRGGALVHPHVEGVTDGTLWTAEEHLVCWPLNDWPSLKALIDNLLADEPFRRQVAEAGRAHTLAHHTYTHRVAFAEWVLAERGLL